MRKAKMIKSASAEIKGSLAPYRSAGKLTIVCIGKKGADYFKKYYSDCNIIYDYVTMIESVRPDAINKMVEILIQSFEKLSFNAHWTLITSKAASTVNAG
jgi:F-type H+-transporting ATPase subunit gamma